jgi:hypothetical protein
MRHDRIAISSRNLYSIGPIPHFAHGIRYSALRVARRRCVSLAEDVLKELCPSFKLNALALPRPRLTSGNPRFDRTEKSPSHLPGHYPPSRPSLSRVSAPLYYSPMFFQTFRRARPFAMVQRRGSVESAI